MTAPLGDRGLMPQSGVPRWLGDVSTCGGPWCTQTATAEASIPLIGDFQLVVGGGGGRMFGSKASWTNERRLDLRYTTNAVSAWAGAVRTDGLVSDTTSPLRTRLESGFRFSTTKAELAVNLSVGRRAAHSTNLVAIPAQVASVDSGKTRVDTVPGSRASSRTELLSLAEVRGSWAVGRFLLSTIAGHTAGAHSMSNFWGSLEAATPLPRGPLAFLNVGFANAPGTVSFVGQPRRSMSLGLRFSSATFATRAADQRSRDGTASMFTVQREAFGRYRLRLRMAGARFVELASDCTEWKPIAMTRGDGSDWEVVLPVSAGSHLVNIRVDGGAWIAPPGLVAKSDDFAGVVGVFVVD